MSFIRRAASPVSSIIGGLKKRFFSGKTVTIEATCQRHTALLEGLDDSALMRNGSHQPVERHRVTPPILPPFHTAPPIPSHPLRNVFPHAERHKGGGRTPGAAAVHRGSVGRPQGRPASEIPPVCPLAQSCYVISSSQAHRSAQVCLLFSVLV